MRAMLLLIAIPIIEIALFVVIGGAIGVWATLAWIGLAVLIGIAIINANGVRTLASARATMMQGQDPGAAIFGAAIMLIAGILLIIPGFFTDFLALALMIPPVRAALYSLASSRLKLHAARFGGAGFPGAAAGGFGAGFPNGFPGGFPGGFAGFGTNDAANAGQTGARPDDGVIDGDFEEVRDPDANLKITSGPRRPSGWTQD